MKRSLLFLLPVALLVSCATKTESGPKPGYYGGDGSRHNPVVIVMDGPDYTPELWLERKYPGCFVKGVEPRANP